MKQKQKLFILGFWQLACFSMHLKEDLAYKKSFPIFWAYSNCIVCKMSLLLIFFFLNKLIFIYLKAEKQRKRQREIFHVLVQSPNTCRARRGPGQTQELGTPLGSAMWVAGTQVLEPSSAACKDALGGSCLGGRGVWTCTGALRRNAGIPR